MALELLTKDDLNLFKTELFNEIKTLLLEHKPKGQKEYLKTWEVIKNFDISKGKLQAMRESGKIPFTRIGKCIYFEYADIKKIMDENKVQHKAIGQGRNRFSIGK